MEYDNVLYICILSSYTYVLSIDCNLSYTYSYTYPLGISVTKGRQFTEGVGRVTDHCCVDVSGEHDCTCGCVCARARDTHACTHTYVCACVYV